MNPHRLKAYFYLFLAAIIWGIAGPIIKLTLGEIKPDIFLFYRFFLSTLVVFPFAIKSGLHLPVRRPKVMFMVLLFAFLNSTATLGLLFWGTSKTSLLNMSLISLFAPLVLVLFGYFFLHDHLTKQERIGTLIAFTGAFILAIAPILLTNYESGQFLGNILILSSVICGAFAGVLVKKLMQEEVSPLTLTNITFIVGFLTMAPIVVLRNGFVPTLIAITQLPFSYQLGVIYMAAISGNLAYFLSNLGQRTIEVSEAAPFSYLYPIFSAILAVFLLGDKLTVIIIIGSIIIFAGVFLAEWKKRRYNS
jgi:drug/metabolite transporter (DMT)-like permease